MRPSRPIPTGPNSPNVRLLTATNHHHHTTGQLGFIRYTLLVTVGDQSWSIIRRFNDFQPLHEALSRAFPASAFRAQLPPKKWFGRCVQI